MYLSDQIRKKFIEYWTSSPRDHKEIPNMSLLPNNDSTLLFVNAGMFPLASFLAGEKHPLGKRLCNIQHCLRPKYEEVIEIGDSRHTIMFEMIGNWSLGDFDKSYQIPWILEFYVKVVGLDPNRIYVTVWQGNDKIPMDTVAIDCWKKAFREYGIEAEYSEDIYNTPKDLEQGSNFKYRIFPYGKSKNWWQRGEAVGELGGPSSEIFYDLGTSEQIQEKYHINDDSGRFVEIGNNVFMEYYLDKDLNWQPLKQKNIDFGGGFERLVMCVAGLKDIFDTDLFESFIKEAEIISGKKYKNEDGTPNAYTSAFRVIADHARAATFIIADGILPSNKDQGYILRRFIRRMVRFGNKLGIEQNFTSKIGKKVIERMSGIYSQLDERSEIILNTLDKEESNFRKTLTKGLKEIETLKKKNKTLDGNTAFYIYETYGYPIEMTVEEYGLSEEETKVVFKSFKEEEEKHKAKSREGAGQKFKGGLADQSAEVVKLHTAHHLLLSALQKLISTEIKQRGSNITGERLRMDFNFSRKLEPEEIKLLETQVNEWISKAIPVTRVDMPKEEAEKLGAQMEFGQKYPEIVSVYKISSHEGDKVSLEFCGGPHVKNTSEIGEGGKKFSIFSQENIGGGLRRIKAKLI